MTIFWMQQSDSPKEQCEGLVDIENTTTKVTCTPLYGCTPSEKCWH